MNAQQEYTRMFTEAAIEAALWADTTVCVDGDDCEWGFVDARGYDLGGDVWSEFMADTAPFVADNWDDLIATGRTAEECGHDFQLSRNGHGTGFWDRDTGAVGDRLHDAAKAYGELTLYVDGFDFVQVDG